MKSFHYTPAHDLGLHEAQRLRSPNREPGLLGLVSRSLWWATLRTYLALGQRVTILGRENLPAAPPFVLAANHASHLDAVILAMALPLKLRNACFPIAAGDTFFETRLATAFSAGMMNALPMWRKNAGHHALQQLRRRLTDSPPCGYILFPEGTRSRSGAINPFHAGIGMLVAATHVPVVPCHLAGTFHALPPEKRLPRRSHITLRIGSSLNFQGIANEKNGWKHVAATVEAAIRNLAKNP